MRNSPLQIYSVELPLRRPFNWRVLSLLVAFYFLGNLAGLPLLQTTQAPIEPVWFWGVATLLSAVVLGLSMLLANRTGLGAPFIEGQLPKQGRYRWMQSGLALTVLLIAAGLPLSLWLNLEVDPTSYPAGYLLVLASVKAGIVEELLSRFFMVSLFVWLGSRFSHSPEGRPTHRVYWGAILLAGLLFGWAHVDARLGSQDAPLVALAAIMLLSTLLGIAFGWLYWKLGLEWAIFAHFAYDAVVSAGLLKVYLLANSLVWAGFLIALVWATWMAWRVIGSTNHLVRML